MTFSDMDFLQEKLLLYNCEELIPVDDLVRGDTLILYYFTNMDCHPCRLFDDKLRKVHSEATARNVNMLVIVVSTDADEDSMMTGLKNYYPNWYAVPYGDELRWILRFNYEVTSIPYLIVVRSNGEIITKKGRTEIENIGINVLITWSE